MPHSQDHKLVASEQDYEIEYLAQKHNVKPETVRKVILKLGKDGKPCRSRKTIEQNWDKTIQEINKHCLNKQKIGRKSKYDPSFNEKVFSYLKNGGSPALFHISMLLGVNLETIAAWRKKYPEFKKAIDDGIKEFLIF